MRKNLDWALAALLGLAVGMATLVGQKYLPGSLNSIANSGAVWLVPAFLLAFFLNRELWRSVFLTVLTLLGCVYGYYAFEALCNSHAFAMTRFVWVWTACAAVGGAIFGGGAYLANRSSGLLRCCAMNLLPAVFLAEGLSEVLHLSAYLHMIPAVVGRIVIGFVLYGIIDRREALRPRNMLSLLLVTALGMIGFEGLYWVTAP